VRCPIYGLIIFQERILSVHLGSTSLHRTPLFLNPNWLAWAHLGLCVFGCLGLVATLSNTVNPSNPPRFKSGPKPPPTNPRNSLPVLPYINLVGTLSLFDCLSIILTWYSIFCHKHWRTVRERERQREGEQWMEEHSTTRAQWMRSLGISRVAELAWSRPSPLVGLSVCSKMSCFCVWFPRKENGGDFQILVCCVVLSFFFRRFWC
jgi:hypothetical protein